MQLKLCKHSVLGCPLLLGKPGAEVPSAFIGKDLLKRISVPLTGA